MDTWIAFALIGLGAGAIHASLATGLIVTYKGTGVINVATGALAMWGAYTYHELLTTGDLVLPLVGVPDRVHLVDDPPFAVALTIGVLSGAVIGLLVHTLVFRWLSTAPVLAKVVATVGLMLTFQSLVVLKFGNEARALQPILPNETLDLAGVSVNRDRLYLAGVVICIGGALAAWFRWSRSGLAVVAAAEDERAVSLAGYSPSRLARRTWIVSTTVTTLMVILTAPTTNLNPGNYTLFVVPALAAALLGRLRSLGVAIGAGLGLGMVQSVITRAKAEAWYPDWAEQGATDALPFIVIVVALFLLGRTLPDRGTAATDRLPDVVIPSVRPAAVVLYTLAGGALIAATSGSWRFAIVTSLIGTLLALSLVVLTGLVGQISLAQAAFAGAAGFSLSRIGTALPFPISVLTAALVAMALGVLVGIPALRIRGAQLAVVTLAAAVAIEQLVFRNPRLTPVGGNLIPDPSLFGLDLGVRSGDSIARLEFGLLVLFVVVLAALGVANVMRSATGRRFLAVRANERAGSSLGIDVPRVKLIAFACSSFLAGLGGAFIGYGHGQLSPASFGVFVGISLLAFAYLGGITSLTGAFIAGSFLPLGIGYTINVRWIGERIEGFDEFYLLLSGLGLVVAAVHNPDGIAGTLTRWRAERRRAGRREPASSPPPVPASSTTSTRWPADGGAALDATGIEVTFGGVRAVGGVDLRVERGRIVGLIGPNGAGKTTFIDAITGFVPAKGRVMLGDSDLTSLSAHHRARQGLVRTWQSLELFGDLTVRDNIVVGTEPATWRSSLRDLVRPALTASSPQTDRALDLLGLRGDAGLRPAALSLGRQKLVGVARALAMDPAIVVLDEPAAGLDSAESAAFGARIRAIADAGTGVLLIDHDMPLVLAVCDDIYVIDFGQVIAHGPPAAIREDPRVVEAYLGGPTPAPVTP